jgi:MFS family permease
MQTQRWSEYSPVVGRLFMFTFIVGVATGLPEILFNFYLVSLGFDNTIAGQMVTLTRLSGFLFGIPLGLAVDRFGGIRVVQIVGIFNILTWVLLLNTNDLNQIRLGYFFAGTLFTAQATAILPLLSRVTTPAQRPLLFGVNFAILMATGSVSALIGGYLPGVVAELQGVVATSVTAYRLSLHSVLFLTALALLALTGLHRRIQLQPQVTDSVAPTPDTHMIARRLIVMRSAGRFTLGFAGGMLHPFINLYLRQTYDLSDGHIGVIIAIYTLASVIAALVSSAFITRLGAQRTVVTMALVAAGVMGAAFIEQPIVFVLTYTASMFFIGQIYPAGDVLILNTVASSQRGFTTSINNMLWSLGWGIAASLSGWLQVTSGFTWPFIMHIICMLLTAWLFWRNHYPTYASADRPQTT